MLKQFQLKESKYDASELFKISSELTDSEKRLLVQGCVLPGFEFFESGWDMLKNWSEDLDILICQILDNSNIKSSKDLRQECCIFSNSYGISEIRVLPNGINSLTDLEINGILDNAMEFVDNIIVKKEYHTEIAEIANRYESKIDKILEK